MSDTLFYTCPECSKLFYGKSALRDHLRRNHWKPDLECFHCKYTTKFKFQLAKHMNIHINLNRPGKVHRRNKNLRFPFINCPLCKTFECKERSDMIKHYVQVHNVHIAEEIFGFDNYEEFTKWKKQTESTECLRFVLNGKNVSARCETAWYRCFRDGYFKSKSKGKRLMKKDSFKINSVCPCSVKVVKFRNTGVVNATYVAQHVGHTLDEGRVKFLKKHEKIGQGDGAGPDSKLESTATHECKDRVQAIKSEEHFVSLEPFADGDSDEDEMIVFDAEVDIIENRVPDCSFSNTDLENGKKTVSDTIASILKTLQTKEELDVVMKAIAPIPRAIQALKYGQGLDDGQAGNGLFPISG